MLKRHSNARAGDDTLTDERAASRRARGSVPAAGSRGDADLASGRADAARAPGPSAIRSGAEDKTGGLFRLRPNPVNVKLIYAAYLASLAIPFAAPIGAFAAYGALKAHPPRWLATHYVFQLRTFWIGLGANIVAYALTFAGVGLLLFPLIAIWVVARSVKGLIRVANGAAVENPNGLFV